MYFWPLIVFSFLPSEVGAPQAPHTGAAEAAAAPLDSAMAAINTIVLICIGPVLFSDKTRKRHLTNRLGESRDSRSAGSHWPAVMPVTRHGSPSSCSGPRPNERNGGLNAIAATSLKLESGDSRATCFNVR